MNNSHADLEKSTIKKISLHLMPLFTIGYFLASLDRVNVGFAALQMNNDIDLSATSFGFGAGLFFIAYCLCAIPCNMLMVKIGAKRWLSAVMITWGILSACMVTVQGPISFYILRFLLGIAEAGFFPGVIYYFTLCFPKKYRGRMVAILMMALPVSSVIGSPLSAMLLNADGIMGIKGWHWLFIIEGLPATLLGLLSIRLLPTQINQAKWLSAVQRQWLSNQIASQHDKPIAHALPENIFIILFHPRLLLLTLIYMGGTAVTNGLALWQPQFINAFNLTTMQIGLLNAVPFAIATLAMYLWGQHSDKHNERRLHTALPLMLGILGLAGSMYVTSLWLTIFVLCIIIISASMIKGPFWAMATELLPASTAAVAIGAINALNNVGVFMATWLIGYIRTSSGSFTYALLPLLLLTLCACIATFYVGQKKLVYR